MSTTQIIWLVIAVVVVVAVVAMAGWASRRRAALGEERDHARAEELRAAAESHRLETRTSEIEARQSEVEAERARLEAERADARAAETERATQIDQARYEDALREADRLDPPVDAEDPVGDEPAREPRHRS